MRDSNDRATHRSMALALAALMLATLGTSRPASAESDDPWARSRTSWPLEHSLWPPHLARGRIGVQVQEMTPELREHMKAHPDRGILVSRVVPDSPGAAGGLRVGDVIVKADNDLMERPFDLVSVVAGVIEGDEIELKIVRDGKKRELKVALEGKPRAWMDPDHWGKWMERGLRHGSHEMHRLLRDLERRLEDIERRLESDLADDSAEEA